MAAAEVHPTATVHPGTVLGEDVRIMENAVVGKQPVLSPRSTAKKETLPPTRVGADTVVSTGAIVFAGLALAYRTRPVFVPTQGPNDPVARYRQPGPWHGLGARRCSRPRNGYHRPFRPEAVGGEQMTWRGGRQRALVTVLAVSLVGQGLNDALNPRLKGR